MKRAVFALLASAGISAGSLLIVASPAWASPQSAQVCSLFANPPIGSIHGQGGRGGCGDAATFTVGVFHELGFQPDPRVGVATGQGNQTVTAYGNCDGNGIYYTYTESSTGNVMESARVTRC